MFKIQSHHDKTEQGILTDPEDINHEFHNYFSTLDSSAIHLDKVKCKTFVKDWEWELKSQSQEESWTLNSTITLDVQHKSLWSMKQGQSPGWDGFPPEFDITF